MSLDIINIPRRKLVEALGENAPVYFNHMKLWFKMKLTKEEFDSEARSLLSPEQVRYHNEFFLALLNKVHGLAEISILTSAQEKSSSHNRNSRKHKRSSRTLEKTSFEPAELIDYLPPASPPGAGSEGIKYAAQELFLPDHALVMGRFMLSAWELGLEGAEDETADIVVVAVQNFLKNILSTVISQRKSYKVRNGCFVYDSGADVPNIWLRNSVNSHDPQDEGRTELDEAGDATVPRCLPTLHEMEQTTAYALACSVPETPPKNERITLEELYLTFQNNRNLIASHSMHTINLERIALMLHYPNHKS